MADIAKQVRRIDVTGCHDCPHHDESTDPWVCGSAGRLIPRGKYFDSGPPFWCPLYKADHLLTVRKRKP